MTESKAMLVSHIIMYVSRILNMEDKPTTWQVAQLSHRNRAELKH